MLANRMKELWSRGEPVLNGWLSIPSAFTAEIMAAQGYDSIGIDLQHGVVDYQVMVGMLQAMRASGTVPIVRVPWLDPASIMKVLDAGAYGVIVPMIDTADQAAEMVSYVRYPPVGTRSFGPGRAVFSAGADYGQHADNEVVCFAMVETAAGLANVEAIARTPGLDGIYVGPADLTLALTGKRYPIGFDREEPEMVEALSRILDACKAAGIKAALHCGTPSYAAKAVGWGFDMVTLTNDVRLLAAAASANVKAARDQLRDSAAPSASIYMPSY